MIATLTDIFTLIHLVGISIMSALGVLAGIKIASLLPY